MLKFKKNIRRLKVKELQTQLYCWVYYSLQGISRITTPFRQVLPHCGWHSVCTFWSYGVQILNGRLNILFWMRYSWFSLISLNQGRILACTKYLYDRRHIFLPLEVRYKSAYAFLILTACVMYCKNVVYLFHHENDTKRPVKLFIQMRTFAMYI